MTEDQLVVLLIACLASTGPSFRCVTAANSTVAGRTTRLGYRKSWAAAGYAGTYATPSGSSATMPLLELVA